VVWSHTISNQPVRSRKEIEEVDRNLKVTLGFENQVRSIDAGWACTDYGKS
jgi:hypothetical protein